MKRCTNCGDCRPLNMFGKQKDSKGGSWRKRAVCKECRAELRREEIKKETPEERAHRREVRLRRTYGITIEQYNTMFAEQEGKCLGSERHQSEFPLNLSVDHCHETKIVRGLLCSGCNLAIGNVEEDPQTLINLASYLEAKCK